MPYQLEGANRLYDNHGGICAFRVGRGKTPTALAVLTRIKLDRPKPKFLVVCPAVLKYQWQKETAKFAPNLTTQVIDGSKIDRSKQFNNKADIYITNYEQLRHDPDKFLLTEWDAVIMDEAHKLGNPTTKQSKIGRKIKADWKIALTGTPISNHPSEVWPVLWWINPLAAGSWWTFVKTYCTTNPWGGISGTRNLDKLADVLEPYLLTENEDIGIGVAFEEDIEVELSNEEAKLYEQIRLEMLTEIDRELIDKIVSPSQIQNAFVKALRLSQITGSMELVGANIKSTKIEKIKELLKSFTSKTVVYTRYSQLADILERELSEFKPLKISGSVSNKIRQESIDLFNTDDLHKVMIVTDAGSHGINLHFKAANQIFCDTPYSLGKKTQVTGRVHRFGQTEQVRIYYMMAKVYGRKTIDYHIKTISTRKADVARKTLRIADIKTLLE